MSEILYVQPVPVMRNGKKEVWLFKFTDKGWKPHRQIKDVVIEAEIIEESSSKGDIVS